MTTVIAWIVEATWPACVDAVRDHAAHDAEIVLLHVPDPEISGAAHGAFAGLLGRARPDRDPGTALEHLMTATGEQLLADAAARLGRPCACVQREGRVEREVVAAAEGADLLVVARDGDPAHLGPRSIGHTTRFVVDHAPCPLLLIWPHPAPSPATIPPPPPHPPHGGGPHHRGGPPHDGPPLPPPPPPPPEPSPHGPPHAEGARRPTRGPGA